MDRTKNEKTNCEKRNETKKERRKDRETEEETFAKKEEGRNLKCPRV